jgi:hypothetical protein
MGDTELSNGFSAYNYSVVVCHFLLHIIEALNYKERKCGLALNTQSSLRFFGGERYLLYRSGALGHD